MTLDQHQILWDELGFDKHEREFMIAKINGCNTVVAILEYCGYPTRPVWQSKCWERLQGMHRKYMDWKRSVSRAIDAVNGD